MARAARSCLPEQEPGEELQFVAALSRLSAVEIIQLKCLTGATCHLQFQAGGRGFGSLFLDGGEIVHAQVGEREQHILKTGLGALYEILYEASNRPDWVELPIAGVLEILNEQVPG